MILVILLFIYVSILAGIALYYSIWMLNETEYTSLGLFYFCISAGLLIYITVEFIEYLIFL